MAERKECREDRLAGEIELFNQTKEERPLGKP